MPLRFLAVHRIFGKEDAYTALIPFLKTVRSKVLIGISNGRITRSKSLPEARLPIE